MTISKDEARILARLAWNNWPDNEGSRREIARHEERDPISAAAWERVIAALLAEKIDHKPDSEEDIARLRANHRDCVETKRRTGERLKAALAALQKIYTIAGDGFEKATHDRPRSKQFISQERAQE